MHPKIPKITWNQLLPLLKGEKLISEEQQNRIAIIFKRYGYNTDNRFDEYVNSYQISTTAFVTVVPSLWNGCDNKHGTVVTIALERV